MTPFVFHEPSGRRGRRFRRAILSTAIVCSLLAGLTLVSVVVSPELPSLGLPAVAHGPHLLRTRNIASANRAASSVHHVGPGPEPAAGGSAGQPLVFGYYVNWDASSIVSLRLNLRLLAHLVPQWFTLWDAGGDLQDTVANFFGWSAGVAYDAVSWLRASSTLEGATAIARHQSNPLDMRVAAERTLGERVKLQAGALKGLSNGSPSFRGACGPGRLLLMLT